VAYLDTRTNTSGLVSYRVKYRDTGGKERVVTFETAAAAEEWRDVCNAIGPARALRLLDEEDATAGAPSVAELLAAHIAGLTGIERGTREDYLRHAARDITPHLGERPADRVRRADVAAWVQLLDARGLSAKTITNRHSLLSGAFKTAVLDEDSPIVVNPCRGVPMPKGQAAEMVFLEPWEYALVRAHVPPYWRRLLTVLVGTGLRWSEATALQVGDIDLGRNRLHVRRAWKHNRGEPPYIGEPKSRKSRRPVGYGENVETALIPLVAGRRREALVFVNRQGRPVLNNSFHSRVWQPAVAAAMTLPAPPVGLAAGTPEYRAWASDVRPSQVERAALLQQKPRIHDLRHTYAAWSLNAGVSIFALSRAMGHESIKVTVDRYGHLAPEGLDAPAAAADAALSQALG
jgi:integrase